MSTQTALEGARRIAERLRVMVAAVSFPSLPREAQVTVSIGITEYHQGEPIQAALLRADSALYAAKQTGRNRVETAA